MNELKKELIELSYEKLYELDPSSEEYGRTLENIRKLEGTNKKKEALNIMTDIFKIVLPVMAGGYWIRQMLKLEYDEGGVVRSSIGKQLLSIVKFW